MKRSVMLFLFVVFTSVIATACPPPPTPSTTTTTTSTTEPPVWLAPGCYKGASNVGVLNFDVKYSGPKNVKGNITGWFSYDGTCSGTMIGVPGTLVQANNAIEALAICKVTAPETVEVGPPSTSWPGLPADGWYCTPVIP